MRGGVKNSTSLDLVLLIPICFLRKKEALQEKFVTSLAEQQREKIGGEGTIG